MKKAAFFTLGCKVNQYESEAMRESFESAGYETVDFGDFADVYIVNTCSVTAIADRKSRKAIKQARNLNPDAIIAVAGCYSQTNPEAVKSLKIADIIIGNTEKENIVEIVKSYNGVAVEKVNDIMKCRMFAGPTAASHKGKTRAFMKIQDGCDNFCTYCIIPYARGPVRSRPLDEIITEAKSFVKNGYKEIVLTGIHITKYGKDFGEIALADVLSELNRINGLERIRLGSLEYNKNFTEIVNRAGEYSKLCPHFHISLQSGSAGVLERMKRTYTPAEYKAAVDMIRKTWETAAITTDIMVGFPGETEEEFAESMNFAKEIGFAKMHVFAYSRRPGTVADKMENQVPEAVKKARSEQMQALATNLENEFYKSCIGKQFSVLVERKTGNNLYEGHTENYLPAEITSSEDISKQIVKVEITGINGETVTGDIVK
ncbi:MAG: tRNA (N(6)-L-threonylcarbamoyladenosine(37)-C(2))-methylthiotransferase MtaB [Clostridia bacterium]|nr:tRNA (N(6)-L-threonylcarbamoyladenosine(37)-C(2))-methylthiotransferase MtaB [Clostridia bacterium]